MIVKSFAKINLVLEILGKRQDGFHEIQSLMQTIDLHDRIDIQRTNSELISFVCDDERIGETAENLAFRAAELFFKEVGFLSGGVRIELQKKTPIGAGLGGGSSNAASMLKALNNLWEKPLKQQELLQMAALLGSDVPFFINGGTAMAFGRGELITALPFIGEIAVLLINPGFPVMTSLVYSNINLHLTSPGCLLNILPVLSAGRMTGRGLSDFVRNDLQDTVLRLFPEIRALLEWLIHRGADSACVSGSGGTVFGLFSDAVRAEEIARAAQRLFPWVCLTKTVDGTDGDCIGF